MRSSHRYNLKRLCIVLKGFIPSFLFLPFSTNCNRVIFSSTRNEHYNFNSKFLFEYMLENRKDLSVYFVINDDQMRATLNKELGPYFIETKNFAGMWFALQAAYWFTSSMETPVGGFFHRYKRNVIHLGHGAPLKNIGLLEKRISFIKRVYYTLISSNFSWFLAVSEYFKPIIARFAGVSENRVLVSGQPRNEGLLKQPRDIYNVSLEKFRILYAPTWKPWNMGIDWGMLKDENFDMLDQFLIENGAIMCLRMHPYFEKQEVYERINQSKAMEVLGSVEYPEVNDVLAGFDALITDYSSIYFDFLILDRPILFWVKDKSLYEKKIGFVDEFERLIAGPSIFKIEDMISFLKNIILNGAALKEYRTPVYKLVKSEEKNICSNLLNKIGI